jgi:hypothetical protein
MEEKKMEKSKKITTKDEIQEETITNGKKAQTTEETRQAIRDSKVLYLSLSGGWGQTRHWIKQWEKTNNKKIGEAPDWRDSGYICPYCAEKVAKFYVPPPFSTIIYRCSNNHNFSHKMMTALEKQTLKDE